MQNNHRVLLNWLASAAGIGLGGVLGYWLQKGAGAFLVEPEIVAEIVVPVVCLLLGMLIAALSRPTGRWRALQLFILFSCVFTAIAFPIATPGFFTFLQMNGLGYALYEFAERTSEVWVSGVAGMLSVYLYRLVA